MPCCKGYKAECILKLFESKDMRRQLQKINARRTNA